MADGTTEAAEGAEHAAEGAAHAAESAGMPQLDFSTFPNQIFWLLVALVAIYLILSRIALPRLGAVLAERAGTITNDLSAAEELKGRAVAAEAAYDKALADARTEAGRIVAAARAEIQADLNAEMARAEAQIAAKAAESEAAIRAIRDQAVASVTAVAEDTAQALVAALGGSADAPAVAAAVANRMKG